MTYRIAIRVFALLSFLTFHHESAGAETRELLLAAYSVPKEAYEKRINPAFEQFWKQTTGESIRIVSSFAASGAQARAIVGGLDADIAALSLESDLQQLVKAGLITQIGNRARSVAWSRRPSWRWVSARVTRKGSKDGRI
ncbi:MAG: substrate-binding domain-containing protein [Nitrospiraceae bacterium]